MSDFDGIQTYIVNGYQFETREEYENALQEKKGIQFLNSQMDFSNIDKTVSQYNELVHKKIFQSPVGLDYLAQLRSALIKSQGVDKKKIMPVYVVARNKVDKDRAEKYIHKKYEEQAIENEKTIRKLKGSRNTLVILSVILFIMVGAMFYIASTSSNPNILNYERNIQDKYASWAEDLADRESSIRAWEREHNIPGETEINN